MKKVKAKSQKELIHHFIHGVNKEDSRGDYNYEGDIFYRNATQLCKIVSRRLKIAIISEFDYVGTYGKGLHYRHIINALPEGWKVYSCDVVSLFPNNYKDFNRSHFYKLALFKIKTEIDWLHQCYHVEKEALTNDKRFSLIRNFSLSEPNYLRLDKLLDIVSEFKLSEKKILNHIYNTKELVTISYTGWSKVEKKYTVIDKPISFYLDYKNWHTEEELDILRFKAWKCRYYNTGYGIRTFGGTYEEVYNDPIKKESFEKACQRYIVLKEERYRREQAELEKKREAQVELEREQFYKNEINWVSSFKIFFRIRNGFVESSRQARITLDEAKQAFILFNSVVTKGKELPFTLKKPYKVGHYTFDSISKMNDNIILTIGCHKIRDVEIYDFINRNNLQDWFNIKKELV
jgi:hypothetical protein